MKEFLSNNFRRFIVGIYTLFIAEVIFGVSFLLSNSNLIHKLFGIVGSIILYILFVCLLGFIAEKILGKSVK
jgi:hypothetical protein